MKYLVTGAGGVIPLKNMISETPHELCLTLQLPRQTFGGTGAPMFNRYKKL